MRRIIWAACLWMALAGMAAGEARPLAVGAVSPLIAAVQGGGRSGSASLFMGPSDGGFFAPQPARTRPLNTMGDEVALLLALIARAEAGAAGYDAVQHGARIPPPRAPTEMTLGEVYDWITATPGQPHAIGRYQFTPPPCGASRRPAAMGAARALTPRCRMRWPWSCWRRQGLPRFDAARWTAADSWGGWRGSGRGCPCPTGDPTTTDTPGTARQ